MAITEPTGPVPRTREVPRRARPLPSAARVLASASRLALLHLLHQRGTGLPVTELAEATGLHVNTTREHLDRLVEAGFVATSTEPRATRGRPRLLYRAVARPAGATLDPLLREHLYRLVLAGYGDHPAAHRRQMAALETHFEDLGFGPDGDLDRLEVHLRECPVMDLAREQTEVVCGVHLSLTRGVLDQVEGPLSADRLEPFVGPRHCVLHLRSD